MDIAIVGTGYVGLTTGACMAELGHHVTCIDIDAEKIASLRKGRLPIFEEGLEDLVVTHARSGRLEFTDDIAAGVRGAALVLVAVGTPPDEKGDVDLSFVRQAASDMAPHLPKDAVLVLKSTVPAGTAREIASLLSALGRRNPVASNPEFLREGSAVADFFDPDRIVIGADAPAAAKLLGRLYAPFEKRGVPVVTTSTVDAELIKYASNAFLALKIGFINDVADLCEQTGGDVTTVARCVGYDKRIGGAFLSPGPGFGGSCFPKDTRAFIATGRRFGAKQGLVESLVRSNDARKARLAERIVAELPGPVRGQVVTVLGTAFKANTDDMREAAALTIVPLLQGKGIRVKAHDPKSRTVGERMLPGVVWEDDPYAAVAGANAVVILTEWQEYRELDWRRIASLMEGNCLFDYRNLLDGKDVVAEGLRYVSLGRPVGQAKLTGKAPATSIGGEWRDIAAAPF
jgi:UDPglucose 6-dehydrogenase